MADESTVVPPDELELELELVPPEPPLLVLLPEDIPPSEDWPEPDKLPLLELLESAFPPAALLDKLLVPPFPPLPLLPAFPPC